MKTLCYLLCIVLMPLFTLAQTEFTYFHKTYSTDSTNVLTPTSYPVEDGYLTVGVFNSFNHYAALYAQKTDWKGNLIWHKVLEDGQESVAMFGGNTLTSTNDGHFVTIGEKASYYPTTGDWRAVLIKFNKEGEVIWKKFYGDTTTVILPRYILETKDKEFILAGSWRLKNGFNKFHIFKVDSLGNMIWDKKYATNHQAAALMIKETPDGGYIVSGNRFQGNSTNNGEAYLVKIDSLGNEQWNKTFGGPKSDGGSTVTVTTEGHYIYAWTLKEEDNTPLDIDNPTPVQMMKLDSEGNVLIHKSYHIDKVSNIQTDILPTADGGYIAVGLYDNADYWYNCLIYRFDENLDTLWTKPIFYSNSTSDYIRHMIATPDKGYLLTGFVYTTQQSWLVKIDSLGNTCSYVGCDSTINLQPPLGISNFPTQTTLKISPNPIQNAQKATITLPNISHYHQVILQVFNATGQLVQEQWVLPYQKELVFDTSLFTNGVYFCRLVGDGQRIEEGKLVVVR